MSRTSISGLIGRHLRTAPGAPIAVALLVFVLTAITVFGPLALTALSDASLRYRLESVSPVARDVDSSVAAPPTVGPGDEALTDLPPGTENRWGAWDADLEQVRRDTRAPTSGALERAQYFTRFGIIKGAVASTYVATDPRFASRIRIDTGRLPEAGLTEGEWQEGIRAAVEEGADLPPVEIVLSTASAEAAEWPLGETRVVAGEAAWPYPLPLTLVGTFEAVDEGDTYWQHATGILTPAVAFDAFSQPFLKPTAFAAPGARLAVSSNMLTTVWYPFQAHAVTADTAPDILAGLRRLTGTTQNIGADAGFGAVVPLGFRTDAIAALETGIGEGRSLTAILAMLAAGPLGVAIAVLVLGCRMMLERRRPALRLLSARGATGGQQRGLLGLEGLLVGVIPAVLGAAIAFVVSAAVLPGEVAGPIQAPPLLIAPILLALLPAVALAASALSVRSGERIDGPTRSGGWRVVIELAVVGLAVLATALLIVRGVGRPEAPFDPLVVVAPLLLALVVCILTLRVYPVLLRWLLARERRGTGFVGFLGAARALRDPATGLAPVLALVVGVSVAVSAGVLLSTVQSGATVAARAAVGADLQLSASRFDEGAADEVAGIDGVEAVAAVGALSSAEVSVDENRKLAPLYLVDRATLDEVQAGHPPLVPSDVDLGDGTGAIPILFSARADTVIEPDTGELELERTPATIAGVIDEQAPFSSTASWLLIDDAYAPEVNDTPPPVVSLLVRLAPGTDAATVAAEATALLGPGVRWSSPETVLETVEGGPAAAGLRVALIACIAVAAALSAIAVVMTLVLGTRARRRILALLETLGAPPRVGGALVAWELWPVCATALVAGAAFGAALPLLLLRVVDLQPFTGGIAQPAYVADPLVLTVAIGGFLLATAVFTLIALAISRRARAAAILRTVEES